MLRGRGDRHLGRGHGGRAPRLSARPGASPSHSAQVEGARLYRGRELIGSRVAWAGFGYSFPAALGTITYELRIERLPRWDRATTRGPGRGGRAVTRVLLDLPVLRPPSRPLALSVPAARAGLRGRRAAAAGHEVELLDCTFLDRDRALAAARASRRRRWSASTPWPRWLARRSGSPSACAAAASCWWPAARCRPASPRRSARASTWSCAARASRRWSRSSRPSRRAPTRARCPGSCAARARGRRGPPPSAAHAAPRRGRSPPRLDELPFPARDLLPNDAYIAFGRRRLRLRHHDRDEHPRVPVRLRVLQQRGLRRVVPRALAGRRARRGRRGAGPGLRPHLVRRRRLHTAPRARARLLRGGRAARSALLVGVPGPCRCDRRRARRAPCGPPAAFASSSASSRAATRPSRS